MTDAQGDASFDVLPGKYRLRVIVPTGDSIDRRYIEVKVGDRQSRSRTFILSSRQADSM
jgi:hypothetical protein